MGRRKIEIKAIKDDRNRSVTFLKRKGGLFKKAHELSVLCSVDVAVFIFGNNKKLYEYSSSDMHDLIHRYQLHGAVNEHKGPSDFNGGNDDDDDDDAEGTPPRGPDGLELRMMPPHLGQQPTFSKILRQHTPSASPPVSNVIPFHGHHPGHHIARGTTPQPSMTSRPSSRNDGRRLGPSMAPPGVGPHASHSGITYMPTPPIYNASGSQPALISQHGNHYTYPHPQPPYVEDRRPSAPPCYAPHPPPPPPPPPHQQPQHHQQHQQPPPAPIRAESPPPRTHAQKFPSQPLPHVSPPTPLPGPDRQAQDPPPSQAVELKTELLERAQPLLLNTDTAIKKLPQRKSHSIFTPIEENRSILSQHLASFAAEPQATRTDVSQPVAESSSARSQSVEAPSLRDAVQQSPALKRSSTQGSLDNNRNASISSGPDSSFTPLSRSSSLQVSGAPAASARPRGPRLTVQIPDGASEAGSATGESNSPQNPAGTPTHAPQRHNSLSSVVLPPPSPSASAMLSAGATGPPNPFARLPPQPNVNGETPVSALPSRFLSNELFPSPGSFYSDWNYRGSDSNMLPSPLNFATPVVGSGPSFLRDENHGGPVNSSGNSNGHVGVGSSSLGAQNPPTSLTKRKSPDFGTNNHSETHLAPNEPKRIKVEYA